MLTDNTKKLILSLLTNALHDCVIGMCLSSGEEHDSYVKRRDALLDALKEVDTTFDATTYVTSLITAPKTGHQKMRNKTKKEIVSGTE